MTSILPGKLPRYSRACDKCRSKKIKCVKDPKGWSCRQCLREGAECVDSSPIKKRGPRGKKGKIIDALRRSNTPSDTSTYDSQSDEQQSLPDSDAFGDVSMSGRNDALVSQTSVPMPIEYAVADLYPTPRYLLLSELVSVIRSEELHDHESCFAFSLAIYTLLSSLISEDYFEEDQLNETGPVRQSIRRLYAVRSLIPEDVVTTASLATSLVLFHCFTLLGDRNTVSSPLRRSPMRHLRQLLTYIYYF